MKLILLFFALLCLVLAVGGCDKEKVVDAGDTEEPAQEQPGDVAEQPDGSGTGAPDASGPSDPPYTSQVTYPSGLRLDGLVEDAEITGGYPDPGSGRFAFGSNQQKHYAAVGYFIDVPSLSSAVRQEKVSENFKLNEYVLIPERNQDARIYIDPQIAFHSQELRYAWGGALVLASTFRSPEYNDSIGGATYSRHMYGDAVDIKANDTIMAQDLYNLAKFLEVSYLEPADLTIVDRNNPWIHIDDRGWPLNTAETR